jgi:hypothetical protein
MFKNFYIIPPRKIHDNTCIPNNYIQLDSKCIYGGTIFAVTFHGSTGDMASDDEEKGKANPMDTKTNPNKVKELTEKEEPSIDVLQWYLKMIIDSEEDPKIKK